MKLKFKQMKIRLLFLLFIAFTLGLEAQGDLQFNQVLNFDLVIPSESSPGIKSSIVPLTVPTGKVWKVVSASANSGPGTSVNTSINAQLRLDEVLIFILPAASSFSLGNVMPIWLPAGEHSVELLYGWGSSSYGAGEVNGKLSVIEFNIVQ